MKKKRLAIKSIGRNFSKHLQSIEILTGTHEGSRKLFALRLHPNNINRDARAWEKMVKLKLLNHGCPRLKYTATMKRYNSGPLREQLLARTCRGISKCTADLCDINDAVRSVDLIAWRTSLRSKQSKYRDLLPKLLHRQTNDNTL